MLTIETRASPNHGARAPGKRIDTIILHYTGMPVAEGALSWLCDPRSQVSSHYFVFEDGRVLRLVDEDRRAWHAGVSFWAGERDINSRSIGIEIANPGHAFGLPEFPKVQIASVIALCRGIMQRHAITPERVLAHSDIAPQRKLDPGEKFPWAELAAAGVGRWVEPRPIDVAPSLPAGAFGPAVRSLQDALAAYGYEVGRHGVLDWHTERVIMAFQRHFRPARVDGVADRSTTDTLFDLLGRPQG